MSNKSRGRKFMRMEKIDYYRSMGLAVEGFDSRKNNNIYFLKPICPYNVNSYPIGIERIIENETK